MAETAPEPHEAKVTIDRENLSRLLDPNNCEQFIDSIPESDHEEEHEHHHEHDHCHGHVSKVSWRLITMMVLTGIFFLAELVTGFITNSLSMKSDAFHMLSDEASLAIGLVAHKLTKRAPSDDMTYGYARAEVLGGLSNAVFLFALCLTIFFEAIERFVTPNQITDGLLFLIVGCLGLLVNFAGIFIFHDHGHNDNLQGIFIHIIGDFFSSIGVIVSALVINYTNWNGKYYLDPAISVLISAMLVNSAWNLFKKTSNTVLEGTPFDVDVKKMKDELMLIEGMVAIHELHVWSLSNKDYISTLHIVVDKRENGHKVYCNATNVMMRHNVYSTTVQIEFVDDFPVGIDHSSSCFYASSFNSEKRCFVTKPVYQHSIGCPHVNIPGMEEHHDECSSSCDSDSHHHGHDHDHDHDHSHVHDHDHDHEHEHDHHDHDHEEHHEEHHEEQHEEHHEEHHEDHSDSSHDDHPNGEPKETV